MIEIMKLTNKYIELQGSCFSGEAVICYFKDSKREVKSLLLEYSILAKINFGVILIFNNCKIIITSGHNMLDGFTIYNNSLVAKEIEDGLDLRYIIFLCEKVHLCVWSRDLSMLVSAVRGSGAECVLLHKNRVLFRIGV